MPLDPQARFVLEQIAAQGGFALERQSPAEARDAYRRMRPPIPVEPVARAEDRTLPGPDGAVPVRIYVAEHAPARPPVVAFFHGGGWVIGDLETHDGLARALANRTGAAVVAVDYRLAPEHPSPAAADDCFAVTRWLAERGDELGLDGGRIAVCGDSAGGNLAAVVAQLARERGGVALRHQALVYPVTDCDFERPSYVENADGYLLTRNAMRWFWSHYVPDPARRTDPGVSPLRAEKLHGLAPATVVTAEFDPLRDEGEAYAARLREAGVPVAVTRYDGQIHGFVGLFEVFEAGRRALDEIAAALRGALA